MIHASTRKKAKIAFALLFALAVPVNADCIQRALQHRLPDIIDYMNERGYKNVGVLKFRVKKPAQKISGNVGTLNSLMADRLEVGLILANPFDETKQLNIIRDASCQAAKIDGANHVTAEGRRALFSHPFKLAWGNKSATADAFLTGVVQVHDDLQRATVGILCFDTAEVGLVRVCDVFNAELDASSLGELSESFVLRGAFDHGKTKSNRGQFEVKQVAAIKAATKVRKQSANFPLNDPSAPVRLEVRYDGRIVPVDFRNGRAFIQEPNEGQRVEMSLVRARRVQGRLGVVLKVNGENTLYRQTHRDFDCSKWILSPDHLRTAVTGYQLNSGENQRFQVLSIAQSMSRAMDYGRYTGQIQMTVFAESSRIHEPSHLLLDEDEEDLIAMLRGTQPKKTPNDLGALKHQIRFAGKSGLQTRGLIVDGQKAANRVKTVEFKAEPTPVMAVTITYYTRQ